MTALHRLFVVFLAAFAVAGGVGPAVATSSGAELESLGPLVVEGVPRERAEVVLLDGSFAVADVEPLAALPSATVAAGDELRAMRARNLADHVPLQVGFRRPLPLPHRVRLEPSATASSGASIRSTAGEEVVWSSVVEVEDAWRLRLQLAEVDLPVAAEMVVFDLDGSERVPFGIELRTAAGELWTPSVSGPRIGLEVRVPREAIDGDTSFKLVGIGELFRIDERGAPVLEEIRGLGTRESSCLKDASCFETGALADIDSLREAVFLGNFFSSGGFFSCTGALLNNTTEDGTLYALTANHCFADESGASSLEAVFDYRTATCGGVGDLEGAPRVNGATLLATGGVSDFTFVRLSEPPPGRFALLGWSTEQAGDGTVLHRICHSNRAPQRYSRATVRTLPSELVCEGVPQDRYLYQRYEPTDVGATAGGCSGSVGVDAQLRVRGQLLGACGPDPGDICNRANSDVDGSFHVTYDFIKEWLAPGRGNGGDAAGSRVRFSRADYLVREGDGVARIGVERLGGTNGAFSVAYDTTSGLEPLVDVGPAIRVDSAEEGVDFVPASGTLTWSDGESGRKTFELEIVDDDEVESLESLTLVLSEPTGGASLGDETFATLRIGDNDTDAVDCTADETTLCLNEEGRYRATIRFRTADFVGIGNAVEIGRRDSGLFYFFDENNIEMLLKVLRGCGVTGHYWVFYGATTDVEFVLDVEDTQTGLKRQYFNPGGTPAPPELDTAAFPCE